MTNYVRFVSYFPLNKIHLLSVCDSFLKDGLTRLVSLNTRCQLSFTTYSAAILTGQSHSPLVYAAELRTFVTVTSQEYFAQNHLHAYYYITPDLSYANILMSLTVCVYLCSELSIRRYDNRNKKP